MATIVFRTNAGRKAGLGHLVRCVHLARELAQDGAHCLFIVDYLAEGCAAFLGDMETHVLYDAPQVALDPLADANAVLTRVSEQQVDWIILDDYRLGKTWERQIKNAGFRLCVLDDLLRCHSCDLLIDSRWRGEETPSGYDALVPRQAIKLLGPDYTILAADYRKPLPRRDNERPFTIMIGLGGSGDFTLCQTIVDALFARQTDFSRPLHLLPVIGPFASNIQGFLQRYEMCGSVTPLLGETELYPHLCRTDLYIGAIGGTLYQLIALQIPALTFSLTEYRKTDVKQAEDIGHFFHIGEWSLADAHRLPAVVETILLHYERIRRLGAYPRVKINPWGTQRISQVLLGSKQTKDTTYSPRHQNSQAEWQTLSPEHRLRPVCDSDINHYLHSRNLTANRKNMVGTTEEIPFLDHYVWWFNERRKSFLMLRGDTPCLYIWHEIKQYEGQDFRIAGWFVCEDKIGFQAPLLASIWQLQYCTERFPGVPSVAVIHRRNKFSKLVSDYLGYHEITPDHPYGSAIAAIFKDAHFDTFYFMIREPTLRVPYACIPNSHYPLRPAREILRLLAGEGDGGRSNLRAPAGRSPEGFRVVGRI